MLKGYSDFFGEANDTKEEVDALFKLVDTNNNGTIDYSEFIAATVNRNNLISDKKLK